MKVHITDNEGNPWFVAAYVCRVLGYVNAPHVVGKLDEDERSTIRISDSAGGRSNVIISASRPYSLIRISLKAKSPNLWGHLWGRLWGQPLPPPEFIQQYQ